MLNLSWHWSPIALIGLVMLCLLYAFGIRQARKGNVQGTPLQKRRIVAFIVAVVMMAVGAHGAGGDLDDSVCAAAVVCLPGLAATATFKSAVGTACGAGAHSTGNSVDNL